MARSSVNILAVCKSLRRRGRTPNIINGFNVGTNPRFVRNHTTVRLSIICRPRNKDVNISAGSFASVTRMSRSLSFCLIKGIPPITAHYFNEEVGINLQG